MKDHLLQHPAVNGKDSGTPWYQRSTVTVTDQQHGVPDAQAAAQSQAVA